MKVKFKSWEEIESIGVKDFIGDIELPSGIFFTTEMKYLCNSIITLESRHLREDGKYLWDSWTLTDEMFREVIDVPHYPLEKSWVATNGNTYYLSEDGYLSKYDHTMADYLEASTDDYALLIMGHLTEIDTPKKGERYWTVNFIEDDGVEVRYWENSLGDMKLLERGFVFNSWLDAREKYIEIMEGESDIDEEW